MKVSLFIGSLFGVVALANATNFLELQGKPNIQIGGEVGEAVVGIDARGTSTSLNADDASASTLTSTIFDTVVSTIISCASTVTDCPAHSTTQLTLTVPVSTTAPVTQSSFGLSESRSSVVFQSSSSGISTTSIVSTSTTTSVTTFTPPPESIVPSSGVPTAVLSSVTQQLTASSTSLSPISQVTSTSISTSLAAQSGFSAGGRTGTISGPATIVWSASISQPSSFTAHSGFTATGTVESATAVTSASAYTIQPFINSSTSVSPTSAATSGYTPSSAAPFLNSSSIFVTSKELGAFTSESSSYDSSTITSTIISTSTVYPSTITLTTITVTPSPQSAIPSASGATGLLPTANTTIESASASSPSVQTTTATPQTVVPESETQAPTTTQTLQLQPTTTTQTLALVTPVSTPITAVSGGTYVVPGPTCNCPLAPVNSVTVTVSVTEIVYPSFWSFSTRTTFPPVPGSSPASTSATTGTIIPVASCNQDNCLRQFLQSSIVLSFCASYTTTINTVFTSLPTYASMCSNGPAQLSSACSCIYAVATSSGIGASTSTVTTVLPPTTTTTYTTLNSSSLNTTPIVGGIATSSTSICSCSTLYSNTTFFLPTCACDSPSSFSQSSTTTSLMPSMPWMSYSNGSESTSTTTSTTYVLPSSTSAAASATFTGVGVKKYSSGSFKLAFVVGFVVMVGLVGEL